MKGGLKLTRRVEIKGFSVRIFCLGYLGCNSLYEGLLSSHVYSRRRDCSLQI
jgi:hypothetical protein